VASFSRSAIRLDVHSVGLILQSCLGVTARDFNVTWLKDWSFCFQVFSKSVGIVIYHLCSYVGKHFSVHFTLWCNGGPDWRRELTKWEMLQDAAAVREQRRSGFSKGSGAARQSSVFRRLRYPHDYFQKNFATGSSAMDFQTMDFQKDSIHKNYAADAASLVRQKDLHHPVFLSGCQSSPAITARERPAMTFIALLMFWPAILGCARDFSNIQMDIEIQKSNQLIGRFPGQVNLRLVALVV
jgi:hypothetical protein